MRIIGHLDMDAFFAAIEERDHPELKGRPVVVGADPAGGQGRGVVSTANYPARVYGIHSAMPISTAWKLAEAARRRGRPATVFVRGSHRKYGEVSARIMAILHHYAPVVEEASIDEAYFDLSFTGSFEAAAALARQIKAAILGQERLTGSIGIGPNKMVAKIASDFQKPDGLTLVTAEEAEAFLAPHGGAQNPRHRPQDGANPGPPGNQDGPGFKAIYAGGTPGKIRQVGPVAL